MTVLGIPVINRPDLLTECIRSIDIDVRLVVIDNSETGELGDVAAEIRPDAIICDAPANLGVAASWNLIVRSFPAEPYWLIANADAVFGPGDLGRLCEEMARAGPRWVGVNDDWRVFGLSADAIDAAGWFDENFHPIYCEDADYEYRCTLAGVPWYFIEGSTTHAVSAAYRSDPRYADANARTYPENRAYFERKWGGPLRGGERFTTPFDTGGSVRDWQLDRRRLAAQAW